MASQRLYFGCRDTSILSAPARNLQAKTAKSHLAENIFEKANNSFFTEISRPPLRDNFSKDLKDTFDFTQEPNYEGQQLEGIGVYISNQNGQMSTSKIPAHSWKESLGDYFSQIFNKFGKEDDTLIGMHARFTDVSDVVNSHTAKQRLHPYLLKQSQVILTHHGTTADVANWLKKAFPVKPEDRDTTTDSALLAQYFNQEIQKIAEGKKLNALSENDAVSTIRNAFGNLLKHSSIPIGKRGIFNIKIFDGTRQFVLSFCEPVVLPGQPPRPLKFPLIAIHTRPEDDGQDLIVALEPKKLNQKMEEQLKTWEKNSSDGIIPVDYHHKWGILPHNTITTFKILSNGKIQRTVQKLLNENKGLKNPD